MTGCVPDGLRDVPNNDFVKLGLPFCSEHPCVSGGAVPDATNTGLVSDCGMLLAARDTLAGTASLNWSADTPITEWNGVVLGETSGRVTEILLGGMGLNGRIPTELGSLANLTELGLDNNELTGEIPPELGRPVQPDGSDSRRQPVDGRDSEGVGKPLQPAGTVPRRQLFDRMRPRRIARRAK